MSITLKTLVFLLLFGLYGHVSFSQRPARVACIGNSVTYGSGHKNPGQSSYPAVLQNLLGTGYLVKNFGVSGSTLLKNGHRPYYLQPAFGEMLAFVPDIAVIHLGLNDTDPRNWPNYGDQFAADYSWLIDTIRKVNPAAQIFICRLSPIFSDHPRFKSGTREWFWQIQETIIQIAKANKTGLIDFHSPLYARPDLLPDALHPNEEGAAILAKVVYQKLTGDFGGLQLPTVFSSHMVLQRNKPVAFYGTANSKEKIAVAFNGQKQTAIADENGKWKVSFQPMHAGGPYKASISTPGKAIVLDDILIGDVWLCSGQSNMAFPLRSAVNEPNEMKKAQQKGTLRFLNMQPLAETNAVAWDSVTLDKVNKLHYFSGDWQRCDSNSAKDFSAVAYYFAEKVQQQLNIPVGLIQVAVGGADAESWIDRYTMEHDPVLVNELANWRKSDYYQPWTRERANLNLRNSNYPKQRHPYEPCYNYEAGIARFTDFPIQGVIWYQGESNAHNIELYEQVFPKLVESWRKKWGYEFPFYYVQLSSINRASWPGFRFSQLQMLKTIPNSGMAVSSDVGHPTDVHPRNKKEVGERLARLALHFSYSRKNILPYGPQPVKAQIVNKRVIVSFSYAGTQLATSDRKSVRGFTLKDEKGIEREAKAFIQGNKVSIPLNNNENPVELLYGWTPYTDANLVNQEQLPASTFKIKIQ